MHAVTDHVRQAIGSLPGLPSVPRVVPSVIPVPSVVPTPSGLGPSLP